jgi:hypothetical protein
MRRRERQQSRDGGRDAELPRREADALHSAEISLAYQSALFLDEFAHNCGIM